jgi:elongation factor Ts
MDMPGVIPVCPEQIGGFVVKITASMVSELRGKTGAGMMDCKKALTEAAGNMDEAVDILRKKGLSAAAKKAGRVAAEGLVACLAESSRGDVVEVNAETDFVAKNESFQAFVAGVAKVALGDMPADLDALKAADYPGSGRNVADELTHQVATIGENMNLRRVACLDAGQGLVSCYVHGAGKIGVLVQLETALGDHEKVKQLGHNLAMHVAAANPQFLCREEVPADVVEKEKDIMRAKALDSGKPANIVEKIITGQINKFFGEACLLEQAFVVDPDQKVQKVIDAVAKEIGGDVKLGRFVRYQLGEGLEKREDDFAAEVASMTN